MCVCVCVCVCVSYLGKNTRCMLHVLANSICGWAVHEVQDTCGSGETGD